MTYRSTAIGFLALLCLAAHAEPAHLCTWEGAAARYGVNAQVLYAIAAQESSLNPRAVNHNTNGSRDVGLTQVNSVWLPHLSKLGVTPENLANPCINMHVGAYLLSLHMIKHGNTWRAVGSYHSKTPSRRDKYAQTIHKRIQSHNKAWAQKQTAPP